MKNEPPNNTIPPPFRLGAFLVLPDRNRLSRENREVTIEPRLMQVLVYFAGRPGEVVSREQLKSTVWQDPFMGEDSLNRAISDLRRILGDDTTTPHYIETIRKVGYRMVGHTGGAPGVCSFLSMYLDTGYTVVVLSNSDRDCVVALTFLRNNPLQ